MVNHKKPNQFNDWVLRKKMYLMSLKLKENQILEEGQKIKIYYNLHKHVFSICDYKSNLLLAYSDQINIYNAFTKISNSGRLRVLKEKRKNVHAYVCGYYLNCLSKQEKELEQWQQLYYNPYTTNKFIDLRTQEPAKEIYEFIFCKDKKIYYFNKGDS